MKNFYDFTLPELEVYLTGHGKERFRAEQLFRWVYQKQVTDLDLMSNLSKSFRDEVKEILFFELPKVTQQLDSVDGTRKFLMQVEGAKEIEAVLIPNEDRLTLCVSSEVGCAMGCKFCFTSKMGLMRRLSAYEIVGQFINAAKSLADGRRITNIVFMGMGEPLDNADNVTRAIEILHNQMGIGFGLKKITISTSGLAPLIKRVSDANVRLAVSLNATTNEIRDRIMPINRKYPLEVLLSACKEYTDESGDMITFEYVLLKGVNDSIDDAHRIVKLTRGIPSKINLIPFNEHPESGFTRPASREVSEFQKTLMKLGKHVLVRRTMGRDIFAACGQLRSEMEQHPERMAIQ
jgi:23S rRNA (adenine2503-C2)-methyltransferase